MRHGLLTIASSKQYTKKTHLVSIILILLLLLLLLLLAVLLSLSKPSKNNEALCSDSPPVTICLLKTVADFTYVHDTRGVRGREKLLTQRTFPVKKISKDRVRIYVRTNSTN